MSDERRPGEEWESRKPGSSIRRWFQRPLGYVVAGVVAAIVSVVIYAGFQLAYQTKSSGNASQGVLDNPLSADTNGKPPTEAVKELRKTSESFRLIAKQVGPAVVNIKSKKGMKPKGRPMAGRRGRRGQPVPPPEEEDGMPMDPFRDFFERFGQPFPFHGMPQEMPPQTSLGSGVVIDKKGIVVTNNHVVADASEIIVSFTNDKTELKAKVIGTDPRSDLAVLKIEKGGDYPAAEWADSDSVEVGDWAVAIGSPFDLGQTVTVGIISAKGRNASGLGADFGSDLIQTDAAINPGNSGGPLCDLEGKVMGVNTAIYTRSGGYMGIGFAIPSNTAKDVVGKLIKDGKIVRGWLGVLIQGLDPELAKELGIKEGVAIHEVIQDSPAAKAGLSAGDVIIEVDGKPVKDVTELQRTISGYKPGQIVKIKAISYGDKKSRVTSVKIGTLPEKDAPLTSTERDDEPDRLGIIVSPKGKEGVVVEMVQPGSPADQAGIEVGDIIARINRRTVDSLKAYKDLTKAKRLYVEIKRKGRTLFLPFVLPE